MIPIDTVRRLLEASAQESGVESFGLQMAEARRLSNLGPLGLLIREQPTMRLALDAFARYSNQLNEALFLTIEESHDVVVVREELIMGGSGSVRQSTELAIGVTFRMLRSVSGPGLATATRVLRPRRACRSLGSREGIRSPRRVRSRFQRHRLLPRRSRSAQSRRRSGGCAARAPNAGGELHGQEAGHDHQRARTRGDAARHRNMHDRPGRSAPEHRPAHDPPPARPGRRDVFWCRRRRSARARGALHQGRPQIARGGFVPARLLRAERVLTLVPSTFQSEAIGEARSRCGQTRRNEPSAEQHEVDFELGQSASRL